MKTCSHRFAGLRRLALVVAIGLAMSGSAAAAPLKLPLDSVPPGHAKDVVLVRFAEGTEQLVTPQKLLSDDLLNSVQNIRPLFTLPKAKLDNIRGRGKARLLELKAAGIPLPFEEAPDLSLWFKITLKKGTDQTGFVNALQFVSGVDLVELEPLPAPPPFVGATPDFTGQQGYLDPATGGIDADYSWTVPGGTGLNVKIYDVEYSWNQNHEDLDTAAGVALLLNAGDSAVDPFDTNHGTAVLGEMIATADTIGVTGISFDADIGLAPANTSSLGYNPANAIALATADADPGDVILIEQQTTVCGLTPPPAGSQDNLGPSEWSGPVFSAIQSAVALGITVVEAAGNGSVNLDRAECGNYFNRNFQDSGAIIVGAGSPPGGSDRQRIGFSTYGNRVDVQGWGTGVMTTGYGGLKDDNNPADMNRWYNPSFGGTSSASPIVTGSVANLQGVAMATGSGQPLAPWDVRDILVATGSPQQGTTGEHIGPRPNLRRAIAEIIPSMQIPGSLSFAALCVGGNLTKTLNVCNTGKDDLNVWSITSSDPTQFSVLPPSAGFPVLVSADFCFPFEVAFEPNTGGIKSASLTVASNDPVNPSVVVNASGFGALPEMFATMEASGVFGNVVKGENRTLILQVVNQSNVCPLTVTSLTRTAGSTDFEFAGALTGMTLPVNLPIGQNADLPIRFTPSSFTPPIKTATFRLVTNDPNDSPKDQTVSGGSPEPDIAVSGDLAFGDVCAEDTAESAIQVCNVGTVNTLEGVNAALAGAGCGNFQIVGTPFPADISHDFCIDVTVKYTPTAVGAHDACSLLITSNDPDEAVVNVPLSGNTPAPVIDVSPDLGFMPEVVQQTGACSSRQLFPIQNNGHCQLNVTSVATTGDFALDGMPSTPVILDNGELVGDGGLGILFKPTLIARERTGLLTVTYESDPFTHTTTQVQRQMCGEGVNTGARVLVLANGAPLAIVEQIKILRATGNRNRKVVDTVDVSKNLPLQTYAATPPCPTFQFHKEYGTVGNLVQLLPGSYTVSVTAVVNGKRKTKTVAFDVQTCDFNPTVIVSM